ncbi:hypothetical protein HY640_04370 [Candidatus Woesearchaeota archaeon]|nr:hypothetical protein [Candidatus Woesearchaeota archaeon]
MASKPLSEIIMEAQEKAAFDAAISRISGQQRQISDAANAIGRLDSIDCLLLEDADRKPMLITPLPKGGKDTLTLAIAEGFEDALHPYHVKRREWLGKVAYGLSQRAVQSLPTEFGLSAGWLNIFVHVTDMRPFAGLSACGYQPSGSAGDRFELRLGASKEKPNGYKLARLTADIRDKFPGYKVPFTLEFDDSSIETHVASAKKGTPVGAKAGTYFTSMMGELHKRHPELWEQGRMMVEIVEPGRRYKVITA